MNQNLKNIFSFIKEALEIKNKNVYTLKNYKIHYDYGSFYNEYKELNINPDYKKLNINSEGTFFKIKYLKEENKKEIPEIPDNLKEYIDIIDKNDIIPKIDNLEIELNKIGLLEDYREYDRTIKEINRYNSLIDSYNSIYMNLYEIYKKITDFEEKIEIIYGQRLMIWQDEYGNKIQRYILEANLEISMDPINNIITLNIAKDKFRGFVTEFLNLETYKIKDINSLNKYIKDFNENINNENINIDEEVNKYINYVSIKNEIIDREITEDENLKNNITYISNNSGIIIREKNIKPWIEDLTKIIEMCNTTKFNSPILNMFDITNLEQSQIDTIVLDETYEQTKNEEVLFPLPSNDEQYKIVDKVKNSNIVLVQGPPGTGKSHTIANLISHYISCGKRVIVTSEKSKALEVLRDKIPSEIRSLSLALLASKGIDKDLEYSIETLLKKYKDETENIKTNNEIVRLTEKLKINHQQKQEVIINIINLMSKDLLSHQGNLNEIINFEYKNNLTLMDLAIWLNNNKEYCIIPIKDNENYSYTNNPREFFEKLDDIVDDIKTKKYAISSSVPINENLNNNNIELYIKEYIRCKNYTIINNEMINSIKQNELKEDIINQISKKIECLSPLYNFFEKKWIRESIAYPVFINKIIEIHELITKKTNFIIDLEEKLFDYSITIENETNIDLYCNKLKEILELYEDDGSINIFSKFKLIPEFKKLEGLLYNNKIINKDNVKYEDFVKINDALNYYRIIKLIKEKTFQLLNIDLFEKFNIQKNQFGKYIDNFINIFNAFINFEKYSSEIDSDFNKIINTHLFPTNYLNDNEEKIKSIITDLNWYITEKTINDSGNKVINDLREFYKDYNLQNLNSLLVSIQTTKIEEYIYYKNLLQQEINIINQYNNLKDKYPNFVYDKQELISKYIYNFDMGERLFLKENLDKILKYHYVEKYYLSQEQKITILPKLYEQRERLINEEKDIISELVATKGWYYQNLHMNDKISISLNKWLEFKKKFGRGTGKNANSYLRQMQEEMKIAKNSIPVWIMPIDKLIEQYPFSNEPPFDVLIMDESSQSSIFSISALARAKKIIIVGDDKQISPTNAFTSIDRINDLRAKYLKDNPWDLMISKDTSIYDIIKTICGNRKITLTEHFRCLPEIIKYSNKEFYNMEINALKIRNKENTIEKPIKTIYVPNAVCNKIGNQPYNQAEIDRIVMLIGEIINDKQYDNKTIGIIALQSSSKYIQKLTELIMKNYGEKLINERKIKIGSTYDFQGDERDVMILGMVISSISENDEKYNFRPLTTEEFDKSFNVAASRAKEQMILVHSVTLEELSQKCNRYRLLSYCLNYNNKTESEYDKLFESNFEKDIHDYLISKNYKLIPQFKIGKYKIDLVLSNDSDQQIAIECDGDIYRSINEIEYDLERQSVLERCGWKFIRIRASEFYYNKEKCLQDLIKQIESYLKTNTDINNNIEHNESFINNVKKEDVQENFNLKATEENIDYLYDLKKDNELNINEKRNTQYENNNITNILNIINYAISTNSKIQISYGDNNIKFTLQVIECCKVNEIICLKAIDLKASESDKKPIKLFKIERINDIIIIN